MTTIELDKEDLWVLLLSTVRYSLGRQTYMTQYSIELVLKYSKYLDPKQLEQISKEIYEAIARGIPDVAVWRDGALEIMLLAAKYAVEPPDL